MPWPRHHKAQTRAKIVEAAAAAFRASGIAGVRVEDVMARAGLTHGGFYAHFASKEDLLGAALDHASDETIARLSMPREAVQQQDRFRGVIDAYLSQAHVAHPERGCPLASLGPEIARAAGTTQRRLAAAARDRLTWMRQLLPESERDVISDDQLIALLACMVGGVILARTLRGADSARVLDACRQFLHRSLDRSAAASGPRRRPRKGDAARGERAPRARRRRQ